MRVLTYNQSSLYGLAYLISYDDKPERLTAIQFEKGRNILHICCRGKGGLDDALHQIAAEITKKMPITENSPLSKLITAEDVNGYSPLQYFGEDYTKINRLEKCPLRQSIRIFGKECIVQLLEKDILHQKNRHGQSVIDEWIYKTQGEVSDALDNIMNTSLVLCWKKLSERSQLILLKLTIETLIVNAPEIEPISLSPRIRNIISNEISVTSQAECLALLGGYSFDKTIDCFGQEAFKTLLFTVLDAVYQDTSLAKRMKSILSKTKSEKSFMNGALKSLSEHEPRNIKHHLALMTIAADNCYWNHWPHDNRKGMSVLIGNTRRCLSEASLFFEKNVNFSENNPPILWLASIDAYASLYWVSTPNLSMGSYDGSVLSLKRKENYSSLCQYIKAILALSKKWEKDNQDNNTLYNEFCQLTTKFQKEIQQCHLPDSFNPHQLSEPIEAIMALQKLGENDVEDFVTIFKATTKHFRDHLEYQRDALNVSHAKNCPDDAVYSVVGWSNHPNQYRAGYYNNAVESERFYFSQHTHRLASLHHMDVPTDVSTWNLWPLMKPIFSLDCLDIRFENTQRQKMREGIEKLNFDIPKEIRQSCQYLMIQCMLCCYEGEILKLNIALNDFIQKLSTMRQSFKQTTTLFSSASQGSATFHLIEYAKKIKQDLMYTYSRKNKFDSLSLIRDSAWRIPYEIDPKRISFDDNDSKFITDLILTCLEDNKKTLTLPELYFSSVYVIAFYLNHKMSPGNKKCIPDSDFKMISEVLSSKWQYHTRIGDRLELSLTDKLINHKKLETTFAMLSKNNNGISENAKGQTSRTVSQKGNTQGEAGFDSRDFKL